MKLVQYLKMAAKSTNTVTLAKVAGSAFEPAPPDATAHPPYLELTTAVLTTTLATADPSMFGCPGMYRLTLERVT